MIVTALRRARKSSSGLSEAFSLNVRYERSIVRMPLPVRWSHREIRTFECGARHEELEVERWLHVRVARAMRVICYNMFKGLRRRPWELRAIGGAASWRCAMAGVARWGVPHIGALCADERDIHRDLITCACTARGARHSLQYD